MNLSQIFFLFCFVILLIMPFSVNESYPSRNHHLNFKTKDFSPIEIRSNEEFENYYFLGSGTNDDPYIIEGYDIESSETFISIEHTDKYFHIRNNKFNGLNSLRGGISLFNVSNGKFYLNEFSHTGFGLGNVQNITIIQNEFTDYSGAAINVGSYFGTSKQIRIIDNVIRNFNIGIWIEPDTRNSLIVNNIISSDNHGTGISFSGYNSTIFNNIISNFNRGLDIWQSRDNFFINNTISHNNGFGMCILDKSINNAVLFNTFESNTLYGLEITSDNNLVINNSFINNNGLKIAQAYANGSNNYIYSNHWNTWLIPDNDSNGIVDFSYSLSGMEKVQDPSPLVKPPVFEDYLFEEIFQDIEELKMNNYKDNSKNQFIFMLILIIGTISLSSIFYYSKMKNKLPSYLKFVKSTELKDWEKIYYKITIGLENISQNYIIEPIHHRVPIIAQENIFVEIFPIEFINDLKNKLKGRTILILIEMAYLFPNSTDQVNLYKILNIPRSTFSIDINRLIELNYVKINETNPNLQDSRYKNYVITQKGVDFLRMLKDLIGISIKNEKSRILT